VSIIPAAVGQVIEIKQIDVEAALYIFVHPEEDQNVPFLIDYSISTKNTDI
jgi:hypothetical protein